MYLNVWIPSPQKRETMCNKKNVHLMKNTLWLVVIASENCPFTDDLWWLICLLKNGDIPWQTVKNNLRTPAKKRSWGHCLVFRHIRRFNVPEPIGSMYGRLMLTLGVYIDGKWQTIMEYIRIRHGEYAGGRMPCEQWTAIYFTAAEGVVEPTLFGTFLGTGEYPFRTT